MMDLMDPNTHVINPKTILKREAQGANKLNMWLAVKITNSVGSMWTAYLFTIISLISLPAILTEGHFVSKGTFPQWIISASLIALVAWVAQTFIQLVLLPIIMVGQNVLQGQQDAKSEADHNTLTYLANLQEEQMKELQAHGEALQELQKLLAKK